MEQVFNAVFIITCGLIAAASLITTEKLKKLFKAGADETKFILSGISTALVTLAVKYLGVGATWGLLGMIGGGIPLPDQPVIPKEVGWFYYIAMFLCSWFMATGLYNYIKSLLKAK